MFDPDNAGGVEFVRNFDVTDALRPVLDNQTLSPIPVEEIGSIKKRFEHGDVGPRPANADHRGPGFSRR